MKLYTVEWAVPVLGSSYWETHRKIFQHRESAEGFKTKLADAATFIGVRLGTLSITEMEVE